jgi:hypothetical protein
MKSGTGSSTFSLSGRATSLACVVSGRSMGKKPSLRNVRVAEELGSAPETANEPSAALVVQATGSDPV